MSLKGISWLALVALSTVSWSSAANDARAETIIKQSENAAAEAKATQRILEIPQPESLPESDPGKQYKNKAKRSNTVPAKNNN